MYYLIWLDGYGEREDIAMESDDLHEILSEGKGSTFAIGWGDRGEGVEQEIAYSEGDTGVQTLYATQPFRLPEQYRPGGSGWPGKFITAIAPEVERQPFPMADIRTGEHHSGSYPAFLRSLDHFGDSTWHNDIAGSVAFSIAGIPYRLWVSPTRVLQRLAEMPQRYLFERLDIDLDEGQSIEEAIENAISEGVSNAELIATNSPEKLLSFVQALIPVEDDAQRRFRMMELDPKRRLAMPLDEDDAATRFKLMELNPQSVLAGASWEKARAKLASAARGIRPNPSATELADLEIAKDKFEEFHRKTPTKMWTVAKSPIPATVRRLGEALFVLYRSDKHDPSTGQPVKKPIDYIHEHDPGVDAYAVGKGNHAVPEFIRHATALVYLGKCQGFAYKVGETEREAKSIKPFPDLYATPCGRALLVIQDRREVLAMMWGGGLDVEARGIVG